VSDENPLEELRLRQSAVRDAFDTAIERLSNPRVEPYTIIILDEDGLTPLAALTPYEIFESLKQGTVSA
jgi:hypothetical protein